jgi:ribonuclease HI
MHRKAMILKSGTRWSSWFRHCATSRKVAGAGIAVFDETNLIATQMYRLNGRCTNNQAEQLAMLKALECIQSRQEAGKTAIIYTDSRITLQLLTNLKRHTYLMDKIRIKAMEMERNELKVEFSWIKTHAGKKGNELADRLAKEASISCNIEKCYNKTLSAPFQRS